MARNKYNVDETLESKFNFSHIKRSFVYIKRYKKYFFTAFCSSMVAILCGLILPLFTQSVIDIYIPQKAVRSLIFAGLGIIGTVILQSICNRIKSRANTHGAQAVIRDIRRDLFVHLQELPFDYFDTRPHGKILVRLTEYAESVADLITNRLLTIIFLILNMSLTLVFMLITSAKLTLIVLIGIIVFMIMFTLGYIENEYTYTNFILLRF
mgnify:CR=1 FL=1